MALMLTTTDNPFNPFTQFDDWFAFDEQKGYHTCSYLARICKTSPELSVADMELANDDAVREIVRHNLLGIYTAVSEESAPKGG